MVNGYKNGKIMQDYMHVINLLEAREKGGFDTLFCCSRARLIS
jgi:hypothetical protein